MASSSSRLMATPKFFKVILDPKADSLSIPPALKKRMGHNLRSPVFLKVPSGATMEVEVNECSNGKAMLQKGWREFSECYSLGYGHFLVFKCSKKSHDLFNVSIFDKSAVEIDYSAAEEPKTGRDTRKVKSENRENTTQPSKRTRDDVIEISDDDDMYPVKKSLKRTTTPNRHFERKLKLVNETTYEGNGTAKGVKMQRAVVKEETSKAFRKANSFASTHIIPKKNPFHISKMIFVSTGCSLNVPLSFAQENLPHDDVNSVRMVTNGKTWIVRCLMRRWFARLSGGWYGFVRDNGIKVDDVCVFEAVTNKSEERPTWNVEVFRS